MQNKIEKNTSFNNFMTVIVYIAVFWVVILCISCRWNYELAVSTPWVEVSSVRLGRNKDIEPFWTNGNRKIALFRGTECFHYWSEIETSKDGSFQGHSITFVRRENAELQGKAVLSWGLHCCIPSYSSK
jgi:hypothetical protein